MDIYAVTDAYAAYLAALEAYMNPIAITTNTEEN